MMNVFEPLFLLLVLAALLTLVTAAVLALLGRVAKAGRLLLGLAIGTVGYLTIVIATTAFSTRRVYRVNEEICRDDWCITVTGWRRAADGDVVVSLRLRSRAQRVPMGERGTVIYLVDGAERRFDPVPSPADVPFSTVLQPGESVGTTRTFHVPADARDLGVIYTGEGGFPIGWFIITEGGWFQKPPIVRLQE